MATHLALGWLILTQSFTLVSAASTPTLELSCMSRKTSSLIPVGCHCTEIGFTKKSAASATKCKSLYLESCFSDCCATPAKTADATCGAIDFQTSNNIFSGNITWMVSNYTGCGSGKVIDITKLNQKAGTTAADVIKNCCRDAPKCSSVTCTSSRRRTVADEYWKAKDSVADKTCDSPGNCETTCCEKDATRCANAPASNTCGSGRVVDATKKAVKFSTYDTDCCAAKGKCTASFTCASSMKIKSPLPTTECSYGTTCLSAECCDYKDTACAKEAASITCAANYYFYGTNEFASGDDAAKKKTACCKASTSTDPTCSSYWAAAVGGGNALISSARFQGMTLTMAILLSRISVS